MGGKSRKTQKQSSVQTSAPPAWAQPLFERGAQDAGKLYDSGQGGNAYQGQRVADLSAQTQRGMQGLSQTAEAFNNPAAAAQMSRPTAAQSNLADMAAGNYLSQGSPYYRERLNNAADEMSAKVNSQMSGAGRYGSGANAAVLAKNTGNMMLDGLDRDYSRAMRDMLAANGQIDNANQAQLAGTANYLRNAGNAAQAQMLGGRAEDAHNQAKLDADQAQWREEDNQGWNRLGLLQDAARGFAGGYGTQTVKSKGTATERKNPWDTAASMGGSALGGLMKK